MKFAMLVMLILISGCSTFSKVEDRAHIKWNYEYSSDVVHALLVENSISSSNSGKCNVRYSKFRVIESFKGKLKTGETFNATGISAHEYRDEGSEQFLLLKPFIATQYPGYGECSTEEYASFLSIHNWCCSISSEGERSFVMYDMLNSEQSGDRYLVPVADTFEVIRKLKKSSNKSIQPTANASAD
ncbi:hypothetical protein [Amphritea pacifica]|uniref:hypothetical protein n=1 Tax=Amphritea pacifica TaxID=2811233 RepID=UPI001963CA82|nr:hypothetical protein [Amphritea pacifica]MBN1009196.1 hypothetical protein [Amphritea pacifica]